MAVNKNLLRAFGDTGELLTSGDLDLDNPAHDRYFGDDQSPLDREEEIAKSNAEADAMIAESEECQMLYGSYEGEIGF